MKIGLRITTYNRKEFSEQCLKSLIWGSNPENLIVCIVDNASTDGTREMIQKYLYSGSIVNCIILNSENEHLGYSIQQAWSMLAGLKCDVLAGANNDWLFEPGWDDNVLACFNELKIDYVFADIRKRNKKSKKKYPDKKTESGKGHYNLSPEKGIPFIKTELFKEGLEYSIRRFENGYSGPGKDFVSKMDEMNLLGVKLSSPGIIVRSPEYNSTNYYDYYNEVWSIRGIENDLERLRSIEKEGKMIGGVMDWNMFVKKHHYEELDHD
jgi:glycosyltransferase involved in cell wall biosynthesis